MKYDYSLSENDFTTLMAIMIPTISFILYWFIYSSEKLQKYFYVKFPSDQGKIYHILFVKYAGLIMLGVLPGLLFLLLMPTWSLADYGFQFSSDTIWMSVTWIFALTPIIFAINWFASKREKTFSHYPQIRVKEWDFSLLTQYAMAWSAYLLGYELLFRGFLFFPLLHTIGIWPTIAVNIALYSLSHVPKGIDETIGAIILGLILCIATLQTNTIWAAFVAHVVLALSNSFMALRNNPDMQVVKSWNKK
jgi:membrane protease YdiL (CAAX protease family)